MNKAEMLQALEQGKKITHTNFTSSEWMMKDGVGYTFEDGVWCTVSEFWIYRTDNNWNNGWSIWGVL